MLTNTSQQYVGPNVSIESRNMNRSIYKSKTGATREKSNKGLADRSTSSDDEFFCQAARHLKQVKRVKTHSKDRTLIEQMEDVRVDEEPESGVDINFMDEN